MRRFFRNLVALLLLIALIVLWAWDDRWLAPEEISGARVHVRDGDTLAIGDNIIRLIGMDAPEYRQTCTDAGGADWPCGQAAYRRLSALVAAGDVVCAPEATDQYGRRVSRCSSRGSADLGETLVREGLAISPAIRGTARYADAEDSARTARRGIWAGSFATPADWRAAHLLDTSPTPQHPGE